MDGLMAEADDILAEGKKKFGLAEDAENHNRQTAIEDIRFAREGIQWPDDIERQRIKDGRPCLTINKMPAFIRQVVNDARQNKPSIKVHPADSGADVETAEVMNGLIRNIEYTSNADIAYDTAVECAVTGGFGYIRVGLDYSYSDSFDMDLQINRVANPFSVYGDPNSTAADSSDWMDAFVVDRLSKEAFEAKYGMKSKTIMDWDDNSAWGEGSWREQNEVMVAEWWSRHEVDTTVYLTADGRVFSKEQIEGDEDIQLALQAGVVQIVRERAAKAYKVKQRIMTGAEIIKTTDWAGCYIPIIPVYGDEFDVKGKRYFRSLIHNAIDAQRMFNYWRTTATELVALAPRVPYIGRKGTFNSDIDRWNTANTKSHPFLEFDGEMPQRQPLDTGVAAGALQEALNASDDMKGIMGIYDASLGARSNETSGRAIMARQREGDVSTFHFIDNMARAIRHTGRVLIDLIPHVYSTPRVIRVIGEDGSQEAKQLGKKYPKVDEKTGEPIREPVVDEQGKPVVKQVIGPDGQQVSEPVTRVVMALHDLSAGKYDLTVTTGPSFTTRREEAAFQMTEMMRALPASAPILGKYLAKNLDWPGADEIAEELEKMTAGPQVPPEMQQALEQLKEENAKQAEEIQRLKSDTSVDQRKAQGELAIKNKVADQNFALGLRKLGQERVLKSQQQAAQPTYTDAPAQSEGSEQPMSEGGDDAIMQGLTMLGQLIAQQGAAQQQGMQELARIVAAPNEIVRDAQGRPAGSRKVLN